jgi:5-methylcytosine-specific restriction endonuclease McrA
MKHCTKCGASKPAVDFAFYNKAKGLRHSRCKPCYRAWYAEQSSNPLAIERRRIYWRKAYLKRNPEAVARARARNSEYRDRVRAKYWRKRFEIFKRFDFQCQYCGRKAPEVELQIDHIHPRAKGGTDAPSNLTLACRECNGGKADVLLNK